MFSQSEIQLERQCRAVGCKSQGLNYSYPANQNDAVTDTIILCNKHAREAGFCYMCGRCCAGDENFDFSDRGICDECEMEIEQDQADYPEPEYVDVDDLFT